MTVTAKRLVPGTLITTSTVQYYEADGEAAIIEHPTFTNVGAAQGAVQVYLVPSGQTVQQDYLIQFTVDPGETYRAEELAGHVIEQGGTLWMGANVSSIACMISGAGVT